VASLLATLALLLSLIVPLAALATHRGHGMVDEVAIHLSFQASRFAGVSDQLVADVRRDDGAPIVGVGVGFLREVDFLGLRRIPLGRASTDAYGTARVPVTATYSRLVVVAVITGDALYEATEMRAEIVVPPGSVRPEGALPLGEGGPASLVAIAQVMPQVLALTALGIWVLLIVLTAVTVRAIRRGRPSASHGGDGRTEPTTPN
jgi:hypothetical protein